MNPLITIEVSNTTPIVDVNINTVPDVQIEAGKQGPQGPQGIQGIQGIQGVSISNVAVASGNLQVTLDNATVINAGRLFSATDLSVVTNASGINSLSYNNGVFTFVPTNVVTSLGFTPYNATNPSSYISLTALGVGTANSPSGSGAVSYVNSTGVFTYTPPLNITGNAGTVTNGVYTTDTGSVTSAMIADGTIVNGDISASAAIAYSKLALTGAVLNADLAGSIANTKLANSSTTIGTTAISLGASATTLAGLTSVTSTGFVGALTGNASTATTLATARAIQGVNFDGSAPITVVTAGTGVTVTGTSVAIGQAVGTSSNVTFNDLTLAGNLTVNGTTTTINATTIDVADLNITVAKNAATAAAANGAGLTVAGPAVAATLTYSSADDRWNFNKSLNATLVGNVTGGAISDTSITVKDNVFTLQDDIDPTKQAQFQLSGLATGTTRSYTLPDTSSTLAVLGLSQNFTNTTTFSASSGNFGTSNAASTYNFASGATTTGLTKTVNVGTGGLSGSTTNITVGGTAGTSTTTMNGTTNFLDTGFTLQDDVDPTKQAQFQLSVIGTGATRTFTLQNQDGTLAALNIAQNWTSAQTFTATTNILGSGVGTTTSSVGSGATTTGNTKTVNIGTGGVSGSTTNITVGATAGTSNSTFNGINLFSALGTVSAPSLAIGASNRGFYNPTGGDIGFVAGGYEQVRFLSASPTVNYLTMSGAATGLPPTIVATGSDADVGLSFAMKGWNAIKFNSTTGGQLFQIGQLTSVTANFFQALGNSTGNAPIFSAQGSDSTIGLNITSKSFGVVNINTGTGTIAKFQDRGVTTVDSPFIFKAGLVGTQAGVLTLPVNAYVQIPDPTSISFVTNAGTTGGQGTFVQTAISHTANAVNYVNLTGAGAGGPPTISVAGSDANIPLTILSKGTSDVNVGGTSTMPSLKVSTVTGQANSFQIYGQLSGQSPTLATIGQDANIGIGIAAKGTGSVNFSGNGQQLFNLANVSGSDFTNYYTTTGYLNYTAAGGSTNINFYFGTKGTGSIQLATGGGRQAQVSDTASAVNYLNFTGSATNAVVTTNAPSISVAGSDANVNLTLAAKGTGFISATNGSGTAARFFGGVNFIDFSGGASGTAASLVAAGSDANISVRISGLGTGVVALGGTTVANSSFTVSPIASGVNYITATGGQTGQTPKLTSSTTNIPVSIQGSHAWANFSNVSAAIGVNTDITNAVGAHVVLGSLNGNAPYIGATNYSTSSNGGLSIQTNGTCQLLVAHTASAVNYAQITGSTTGNPVTISSQGSDANATLWLQAQGNARTYFVNSGAFQAAILGTGSAVNYLTFTGGQTGNGATISVQGSETDANIRLVPKGAGYVYIGNIVNIGADYSIGATISAAGSTSAVVGTSLQGFYNSQTIDSTKTSGVNIFSSYVSTAAASFNISTLVHYKASFFTLGAGSSITNQYGFFADSGLTAATNNYGFYGNIAAAAGRYNFYANGTADNYFAGSVGIGAVPLAYYSLNIAKSVTGSTYAGSQLISARIQPDVTGTAYGIQSQLSTGAATFTLSSLVHFHANPAALGAGSTLTNNFGFYAESTISTGTNNYGFFGNIASGANRYNFYAGGTAANVFVGNTTLGGAIGNQSLQVNNVSNAVNYLQIAGGATNGGVSLSAQGNDANIYITYNTKGNEAHGFLTGGGAAQQFRIIHTNGVVNYINVTGAGQTASPTISAGGSDANIGLVLTSKGTGVVTITSDAVINGITAGIGGGAQAQNTVFGYVALPFNTTGNFNVAIGYQSMFYNKIGSSNVGLGYRTLFLNTTASNQLAMGQSALSNVTTNVATFGAITAGSGYTNGTYSAVAMTPVSGATFVTYPTVTVVVSGGVVSTVTLVTAGEGASSSAATVLTVAAALIGGTGSGFSISVGSFAAGANNIAIGSSAGSALTTGSNNTIIGYNAAASTTTVSNEVTLGNGSVTSFRIPGLSITAADSALTIGTQFAVTNTGSAVNYIQVTGSGTNGGVVANAAPSISALGSDTNINLVLAPKGTGSVVAGGNGAFSGAGYLTGSGASPHYMYSASATSLGFRVGTSPSYFQFTDNAGAAGLSTGNPFYFTGSGGYTFKINNSVASSVNYLSIFGNTTGKTPMLYGDGSDTNVGLSLSAKGTGNVNLISNGGVVNIVNGASVSGAMRTNGGGNYTSVITGTVSAPTGQGGTTATVTCGVGAQTIGIQAAGTGYAVNDVVLVTGGTGVQAQSLLVTSVAAGTGAITGVSVYIYGFYTTALPTNPVSVTNTIGTGSGATFNLSNWSLTYITVVDGGSGYIEQPTLTFSGAGGSAAAGYLYLGAAPTIKSLASSMSFNTPGGAQLVVGDSVGTSTDYVFIAGSPFGRPVIVAKPITGTNVSLGISAVGSGGSLQFMTNNTAQVQAQVNHTASAVNYLALTGAATNGAPMLSSAGSDASVNLQISAKNQGYAYISNGNGISARFFGGSNYLNLSGSGSGYTSIISTIGSDTNVPLGLVSRGTGGINLSPGSSGVNISNGTSLTGSIQIGQTGGFPGTGYSGFPTVTISAPTTPGGVQAVAGAIGAMKVTVAAVVSGGSGYLNGEVLTVVGGTTVTAAATLTITGVSGNIITSVSSTNFGAYSVLPTNPVSVTGGSGSGATFTLGYGIYSGTVSITTAGTGYIEQPTITFTGAGTPTTAAVGYATVGSGTIVRSVGTTMSMYTPGGEQFRVTDSAYNSSGTGGTVNYLSVNGAPTGTWPTLASSGSDTNVGMLIAIKGTGGITFAGNGGITQAYISSTASATNYLQFKASTIAGAPILSTQGSDTNISMALQSKGTGAIDLATGSSGVNISNGTGVTSVVISVPAIGGYATLPTLTFSAPTTSGGVTATVSPIMTAWGYSPSAGGTGYAVNDVLTIVGGTFTNQAIQLKVTAVTGSSVSSVSVNQYGNYSALPTNPVSVTNVIGSGSGATITMLWSIAATTGLVGGSGYIEQPTITISGTGGGAAYAVVGSQPVIKSIGSSMSFNTAGGSQLRINDTTSTSVNFWNLFGAATGKTPTLSVDGSDTNIPYALSSKGSSSALFYTNGFNTLQAVINHTASVVNYLTFTGSVAQGAPLYGVGPVVSVAGSDTNINLNLTGKGSGGVAIQAYGSTVLNVGGSGTGVGNFFNIYPTTNFMNWTLVGTDTNIGYALTTKGTGSFLMATGGGVQAAVINTASAVNYLNFTGAATGASPIVSAVGSDVNVPLTVQSKNAGSVNLAAGSSGVNISNGTTVTAITRISVGAGYASIPTLSLSAPTGSGGVQAVAGAIATMNIGGGTVASGGTSGTYVAGQILTIVGGTPSSTVGTLTIGTVSGGLVTSISATNFAAYTVLPANPISVTGGGGTGATFNVYWSIGVGSVTVATAGSGYVEPPIVTIVGGGTPTVPAVFTASVGSATVLRSLNNTFSLHTPSGEQFRVNDPGPISPAGSIVNYVGVTGSGTGQSPYIAAQGSDANLTLTLQGKGSLNYYGVQFNHPAGLPSLQVFNQASSVNYFRINPAVTGMPPILAAYGSDTNVGIALKSQGAGAINLASGTAGINISNYDTVTTLVKTNAGTGYTSPPSVTIAAPTTQGGVQATASVNCGPITVGIQTAGTGYAVNDVLLVTGGTSTIAYRMNVTAVSGSSVSVVTANVYGQYTVFPTNPVSVTNIVGTGSGATFNLTWGINTPTVLTPGSGYIEQPSVTVSGGGGASAAAYAQIGTQATIRGLGGVLSFNTPGGEQLRVIDPSGFQSTSVNFISVSGSSTGNSPTVGALGADTNVALGLFSKGTSGILFVTAGASTLQAQILHTASAVNYLTFTGATTAGPPTIQSQGSDADINLFLKGKGTGSVLLGSAGGQGGSSLYVSPITNSVNYVRITGAASTNSPQIIALGQDANINLTLSATGTGFIRATSQVIVGRNYTGNDSIGIGGSTSFAVATGASGIYNDIAIDSTKTVAYTAFNTYISTQAAAFNVSALSHYSAGFFTLGAGSSITNQYGFKADGTLTTATNNYGFHSGIASGANRYNFYAAGTAANVFVGDTTLGGTIGTQSLQVNNVTSAVNYVQAVGSVTNGGVLTAAAPELSARGSDTNINLKLTPKGTGIVTVSNGLTVNGAVNALTKSFVIPHPTKPNMILKHGSLEGPEFGVYVRGKTTSKIIELPDYWTGLVDADTITVDLTPIGKHQKLYVEKIEGNRVYINVDGVFSSSINCFYTVWGERKDVGKLDIEVAA